MLICGKIIIIVLSWTISNYYYYYSRISKQNYTYLQTRYNIFKVKMFKRLKSIHLNEQTHYKPKPNAYKIRKYLIRNAMQYYMVDVSFLLFLGFVGQKLKHYLRGWWKIFVRVIFWLFHLISDICSLSIHLSRDM